MHKERFMEAAGLPQMDSAGGLIVNDSGAVLFIMKGGKLDLPKGRVEEPDGCEETAMREVVEETSIERDLLTIISPLCQTWQWFVMEHTGNGAGLKPQLSEGITECRWIHPDNFESFESEMRTRIDYVCSLWKKVFFESGVHKFILGKAVG